MDRIKTIIIKIRLIDDCFFIQIRKEYESHWWYASYLRIAIEIKKR